MKKINRTLWILIIVTVFAAGCSRKTSGPDHVVLTPAATALLEAAGQDSLLAQQVRSGKILGTIPLTSAFQNQTVSFSNGGTTRLGDILEGAFSVQDQLAGAASAAAGTDVLAEGAKVESEVLESQDSFTIVKGTTVIVNDPVGFGQRSEIFRKYLGKRKVAHMKVEDLDPEMRQGFEDFWGKGVPKLDPKDPLRAAAAQGKEALLNAVLDGKGKFEITDTIVIAKRTIKVSGSPRLHDSGTSAAPPTVRILGRRNPPQFPELPPGIYTSGHHRFLENFLAGFTISDDFPWHHRWSFTSGHFSLSFRARYGLGLRVPIKVEGEISPTDIMVRGLVDRPVDFKTRIYAKTKKAGPDFYREVGMPEDEIFDGKELVLEAGFGWGCSIRAAWKNIYDRPLRDVIGFNYSRNFTPPYGRNHDGIMLEIPPRLTRTQIDLGPVTGYVKLGLMVGGDGNLSFEYHPFLGAVRLPMKGLRFTDADTSQEPVTTLPPMPVGDREWYEENFGFTLKDPQYECDVTVTPKIKAGITYDFWVKSGEFDTGWISLRNFRVRLGSIRMEAHRGTRDRYEYQAGSKQFRKVFNAPPILPPAVSSSPDFSVPTQLVDLFQPQQDSGAPTTATVVDTPASLGPISAYVPDLSSYAASTPTATDTVNTRSGTSAFIDPSSLADVIASRAGASSGKSSSTTASGFSTSTVSASTAKKLTTAAKSSKKLSVKSF